MREVKHTTRHDTAQRDGGGAERARGVAAREKETWKCGSEVETGGILYFWSSL